jgi:hypothetical protein
MGNDGEPSYDEDEFALILRKASELQAEEGGDALADAGMALGEIKQIAAEVGIAPEFVERAARIARTSGGEEGRAFLGLTLQSFKSDEISAELREGDVAQLIDVVRQTLGSRGTVTEVLDSVEWSSTPGELRAVHVTLSPREGVTQIQIRTDQTGLAALSVLTPGTLAFAGMVVIGEVLGIPVGPVVGLSIAATSGLLGLIGGRTIFKYFSDRFQHRIDSLKDRLLASGEDLAGSPPPGAQ